VRDERHAGKKILNCPRERNEFVVARARSRVSEWWTRILRRMRARGTPRNSCQALKALFPFSYRDYRLLAPLSPWLARTPSVPAPRRASVAEHRRRVFPTFPSRSLGPSGVSLPLTGVPFDDLSLPPALFSSLSPDKRQHAALAQLPVVTSSALATHRANSP